MWSYAKKILHLYICHCFLFRVWVFLPSFKNSQCVCIYIFICPELENVKGLPGVFIYLFCFQASKKIFLSQYCDPHKRSSLGGLYMQSLTDNIYICEKVCTEGCNKGMQRREMEFSPFTSIWNKKTNVYLLPWGSFHTVPHLLRSFLLQH